MPAPRLDKLAEIVKPQKTLPTTMEFVDIAGLVAGASKGEGLGNKFLANIRECDAIVHVVRAFENPDVTHVDNHVDPKKDIETINTELILADLQSIDRHLPKLQKEAKANPSVRQEIATLEQLKERLEQGTLASSITDLDTNVIQGLQLLSTKPVIYVFNVDEVTLGDEARMAHLSELVAPAQCTFICAKIEEELRGLADEDAAELLDAYGVTESGLSQLARVAYQTLGLQSYLTAGPKEVRAWTIPRNSFAPQAGRAIHTDIERGFIRAEVVSFQELVQAGNMVAAKKLGKVRLEGKEYIVQDGDICHFLFNV